MRSPASAVYLVVAAALHVLSEVEQRLDEEADDPPIDRLLLHLSEALQVLSALAPNDGTSPLVFRHLDRPPSWDFEFWFGQKADGARDAGLDLITARTSAAGGAVDELRRSLPLCRAYLRTIHDQLLDDGLVIEKRPEEA